MQCERISPSFSISTLLIFGWTTLFFVLVLPLLTLATWWSISASMEARCEVWFSLSLHGGVWWEANTGDRCIEMVTKEEEGEKDVPSMSVGTLSHSPRIFFDHRLILKGVMILEEVEWPLVKHLLHPGVLRVDVPHVLDEGAEGVLEPLQQGDYLARPIQF